MPEYLTLPRCLLLTSIVLGTLHLSVPQSWSKGIDWDGALLEPNNFHSNRSSSGNQSNLPGVNTGNPTGSSNRARCNGDLQVQSDAGSSTVSGANCNRNTKPLLRFQEGQIDGILFEFPR